MGESNQIKQIRHLLLESNRAGDFAENPVLSEFTAFMSRSAKSIFIRLLSQKK